MKLVNINDNYSPELILKQLAMAKRASLSLASQSLSERNQALELIKKELLNSIDYILEANNQDLEDPENAELSLAIKDRLRLNSSKIQGMAQGIQKIIDMPDPLNQVLDTWTHANGMQITKIRVPLGVIGIIYEGRPNVTTDAVALAIKSGNSIILRGSRQAYHSNLAIMDVIYKALESSSLPSDAIQYLANKSREASKLMLEASEYIDLIIPRGGEALKSFVSENSAVPVLGAGGGVCHVYIAKSADIDKAIAIALNAKISRPSVCNACETILLDINHQEGLAPRLVAELLAQGVEIWGDELVQRLSPLIKKANLETWSQEYLDLKVSMKFVKNIEEAIEHINKYSTQHSDAIITQDSQEAKLFQTLINSACVYVNASTRFTDGEEFGFGAEMGISTQKMHARGPIGARELCSYKFLIDGNGQIR